MGTNRVGWIVASLVAVALLALPADFLPGVAVGVEGAALAQGTAARRQGYETEDEIAWYARRYRISRRLANTIWVHAHRYDVDPRIVFGLIASESRFDPRAVGREGERGLMQIKLATARLYERRVSSEALLHPETNLRVGLLHLKREVEHFGHDWTLGLLAYNMGRTRISRALERGRLPKTIYAARVLAHLREQPL